MRLYIFRHAWAGEAGDPNYPDDSLRPLTDEGKIRFRRFVDHLVKTRQLDARHILSSPFTRTLQSAQILSELLPSRPKVETTASLAMGVNFPELIKVSNTLRVSDLVWVGHNPDVSRVTAALCDEGGAYRHFSKGSAAAINFADDIVTGFGECLWFESPKNQGF